MTDRSKLETLICRSRDSEFYVETASGRVVSGPYDSRDDALRGLLRDVVEMKEAVRHG